MVAPYKRTGLMVRGFDGPRGFALEEGIRTSNQLASSLDRMTSFFFQQASQQRTIEGQEYGAANAPTIEQLREATEAGEDPFNYAPTVFGRNARQAALAQVENEIIVDAAKRFDDLVYEAGRTLVSPKVLQQDLDSAIGGYTEILEATSPALARKMNAKLSMNANTLFDAYRKRYLKSVTASNSKNNNLSISQTVTDDIRNFEKWLSDNQLTPQLVADHIAVLQESHRRQLILAGYNPDKTPIQTALKNHLTGLQTATENFIITAVIENGLNISGITQAIGGGADEIEIPTNSTSDLIKANAILPFLNNDQKMNVAQEIRNSVNGQSNLEDSELRAKINEDTVLNRTLVKEISNLMTGLPNEDNVEEIRLKIKQIRNSQDPQANTIADRLEEELLATGGGRAKSELGVKTFLLNQIRANDGKFSVLAEHRSKLNNADYAEVLEELKKYENAELKKALDDIAIPLGITPDMSGRIPGGSTASAENKVMFNKASKFLSDALDKAIKQSNLEGTPIDFNGEDLKKQFINEEMVRIKDEAFISARDTFIRRLSESTAFQEDTKIKFLTEGNQNVRSELDKIRNNQTANLQLILKWLNTSEQLDFYKIKIFEENFKIMKKKIEIMIENQTQP
jgi:hypothetical protein